ncbi:CNNM domain-containing protein [Cystobacter fuscus]
MLANGIFAGAELALISIRKTRLQELLEQRSAGARAVKALRDNPERLLATVQIGITVVGSTAAAFGGASIAHRLSGPLEGLGLPAHQAENRPSPWWWAWCPTSRWCWASWCPSRSPCVIPSATRSSSARPCMDCRG